MLSKNAALGSLVLFSLTALSGVATLAAPAQSTPARAALIKQPIDETQLVTLAQGVRKEMTPANDRGPVADDLVLTMSLQLNRAPEVQQAMDSLVDQLHDPASPKYHQWLTIDQIESQFAPAEPDIQTVSSWLQEHGFTVSSIYRANGAINFSGPARAIQEAFHTGIHNLSVGGKAHMANSSQPQIPASLAAAVHGVVSLNNFRPRSMTTKRAARAQYTFFARPMHPMAHVFPGLRAGCWYPVTCIRSITSILSMMPVSPGAGRPLLCWRILTSTAPRIGRRFARPSDWRTDFHTAHYNRFTRKPRAGAAEPRVPTPV
jgi:hypothetical protein